MNPNINPDRQMLKSSNPAIPPNKPRLGQGREGLQGEMNRPMMTERQLPIYPDPLIKPPLRPPNIKTQDDRKINLDLDLEINKDFEKISISRRYNIRNIPKTR